MSEDQWADVRQRLNAASETFRQGLREISNEQRLRRAMPNGDRPTDPVTRLKRWGEQLQARRRQQMMRAAAAVVAISFTAGCLGGWLAARGRCTAR